MSLQIKDRTESIVMSKFQPSHLIVSCLLLMVVVGCAEPPQFQINAVEIRKQEIQAQLEEGESFPESYTEDVSNLMVALFGTPDDPKYHFLDSDPEYPDPIHKLISVENLEMAAGAVASLEDGTAQGLYREHCAHCHGVTGGGDGPTASFLNPYPRDFRHGKYKFKSTPIGYAPTEEDLTRVIGNGISGTAMPAFKLLPQEEIDALVDYVIYLSIRGKMERKLIGYMAELGKEDKFIDYDAEADSELGDLKAQIGFFVDEMLLPETEYWDAATGSLVEVKGVDAAVSELVELASTDNDKKIRQSYADINFRIETGKRLFAKEGNCFSCHGYTALGDGQINKYDFWTEDWLNVIGGDSAKEKIKEFKEIGALTPRPVRPRNLRQGIYRGGSRPIDIFWRVANGIDGSPMPSAPDVFFDVEGVESDEEKALVRMIHVWCIVDYIRQLPIRDIEMMEQELPENDRVVN